MKTILLANSDVTCLFRKKILCIDGSHRPHIWLQHVSHSNQQCNKQMNNQVNTYNLLIGVNIYIQIVKIAKIMNFVSDIQILSFISVCLFVCLVFNGTFSTNRLYRTIEVGSISCRDTT